MVDIADLASELADPRPVVTRTPFWDDNRNRKFRVHTVTLPGLLGQLYESVVPSGSAGEGGARTHPGSRPPLALEALSRHTEITLAVATWCWKLRITQRDTVEGNLRALVGASMHREEAEDLLRDMRRWRSWAATMTGWETITRLDGVPCPVVECGKTGSLRLNLTAKTAYCANPDRDQDGLRVCGAHWDDTSIGVLAEYVNRITDGKGVKAA